MNAQQHRDWIDMTLKKHTPVVNITERIQSLSNEQHRIYLAASTHAPSESTLQRLRHIREELASLWRLRSRERVRFVDPLNRMIDDTLATVIVTDEERHVVR